MSGTRCRRRLKHSLSPAEESRPLRTADFCGPRLTHEPKNWPKMPPPAYQQRSGRVGEYRARTGGAVDGLRPEVAAGERPSDGLLSRPHEAAVARDLVT